MQPPQPDEARWVSVRVERHHWLWWAYAEEASTTEGMATEVGPFMSFSKRAASRRARRWARRRNREMAMTERTPV